MLLESRRLLLEASGCVVICATSVGEAIECCAGHHVDAAILCHTLKSDEIEAAYLRLVECVSISHFVRLQQYEDVGYDPLAFIHRVQRVASSL
jgi:hypothetical protein